MQLRQTSLRASRRRLRPQRRRRMRRPPRREALAIDAVGGGTAFSRFVPSFPFFSAVGALRTCERYSA